MFEGHLVAVVYGEKYNNGTLPNIKCESADSGPIVGMWDLGMSFLIIEVGLWSCD